MGYLEAIVLGLVQGLTEFLPISSSAHLSIVGRFFGGDPGAAFTAITQLGTELAVLLYFAKDVGRILSRWFGSLRGTVDRSDPDARMGWLILVGSLPIAILGLLLEGWIDTRFRNLWLTATMLLVFSFVLMAADIVAQQRKQLPDLNWPDGVKFGLWQALALVPGVSRSGGTIAGGLFMGYTREAAARYSFLLAMPAVFASGGYKLVQVSGDGSAVAWGPIAAATLVAGVVGYAVVAWLLRYLQTHTFRPFVIYRIVLALVVFALLGTGVIDAT